MAVTVLQSPTTPNVTGTNLVYVLSSSNSSNPQFRYLTDVYESGSGDYITTIKTYPNISGSGILDVARELDDQLDYDLNWKVTGSVAPVDAVKTFDLRFGEEYALLYNSTPTIYTGSVSNYLKVFPGTVYKNEGSYNFNTSSYVGTGSAYLTNYPGTQTLTEGPNKDYTYLVNSTDYLTVSIFQDNFQVPGYITLEGQKVVNGVATGVLFDAITLTPPTGAFNTVGVGPQNLADFLPSWKTAIDDGDINLIYSLNDPGGFIIYINDLWDGIPATGLNGLKQPSKQCTYEYTRFAFINQYGFWDYYNVYNPLRSNNQVDRSLYERTFVRYEDTFSNYNISNRGNTQYRTEYGKSYTITTDFLDKEMAQWLTEMFESPEVFIQLYGDFVPINIINTDIRWNMNTSREKLFQYDIEFKYANQPQPR